MSPHFRFARDGEMAEIARLVAHSFPGLSLSEQQWQDRLASDPRRGLDTTWVGESGARLVATCEMFRFRQWIAGEPFPIMGLGSVAIAPTHRRRGLAAALVTSGFEKAIDRGDVASALYPFRTGFYQRLGYGMAGEALQYEFPPEALPDSEERARVRLAAYEDDLEALGRVYEVWSNRQTGHLERYAHSWKRVLDGAAAVLFENESGEAEGYLVFRYEAGERPGDRRLEVQEGAWLTPAARRGLHGWLSSLGDQWRRIVYRAHPDEAFAERLLELRHPHPEALRWANWFPSATLQIGPMFRILDLEGAFALRRVPEDSRLTFGMHVRDAQIPRNEGFWRVRTESGSMRVDRTAGALDGTLSLSIDTLSRLFVGALRPSAALEAGIIAIDHPRMLPELDRSLRVPGPWMFDRF